MKTSKLLDKLAALRRLHGDLEIDLAIYGDGSHLCTTPVFNVRVNDQKRIELFGREDDAESGDCASGN